MLLPRGNARGDRRQESKRRNHRVFFFVVEAGIVFELEILGLHRLRQRSNAVGFEHGRPKMLALPEIAEIRALAGDQQAAVIVSDGHLVSISAHHDGQQLVGTFPVHAHGVIPK